MKHPVDTLVDSSVQEPVIRTANRLKAENERLREQLRASTELTAIREAQLHGELSLAARDKAKIEELQSLLESLTPGGSEFSGDPERCAAWVRQRLASAGQLAAERNRLRADLARAREQVEQDAATWFSVAHRAARRARQAERQRCAAIAQDLDCQEPPAEYRIAHPDLCEFLPEWERAQCYHGDRIAAVILGQEDVR
jgi:chromosome segregation ATPase